MALDPVNVALGALPKGIGGDTNRIAVNKLTVALNQIIDAINAGGIGGPSVDLGPVNAAITAEVDARVAAILAEAQARGLGDVNAMAYADSLVANISGGAAYIPTPSIMSEYLSTDNGDHTLAANRCIAKGKPVIFGAGQFAFKTKLKMVEGAILIGAAKVVSTTGLTVITCTGDGITNMEILDPNNTAAKRVRMVVMNLHFKGPGGATTTAIGINGEMGGLVKDCKFEGFKHGVKNPSAFLCRYEGNTFESTNDYAIMAADCNSTFFLFNKFLDHCNGAINVCDLVGTTGSTSGGTGFQYYIMGSSINVNNFYNGISVVKLRGMFKYELNYSEHYGSNPSGSTFLEVCVNQFDKGTCSIRDNVLQSHGKGRWAIMLRGSSTLRCDMLGAITGNYIANFVEAKPIHFGMADGTQRLVSGLRIFDNHFDSGVTGDGTENQSPLYVYRPSAHSSGQPVASVAGATYYVVPIGTTGNIDRDNAGGFNSRTQASGGDQYIIRKAGNFRISCALICRSTAADYANIGASLFVNGVATEFANCGIKFIANPTQATMILDAGKMPYALGDVIQVKCHNGDILANFAFSADWEGDGDNV